MKTSIDTLSPLQRRLNVEIPANVVADHFDRVFKGIQRNAHIKGFRPGKAPIATVRSLYADQVKNDVAQELIQKHYIEALKEHKIEPLNYPEFEFDIPAEEKTFSFSAQFEIRPEVTLKKYEGLEVESEKFEFDEKKVDDVIQNILASRAELVPVLEDRPAKLGDVAVIDFDGFVDGQPLPGGAGKDHNLELGANQFIEGFEDAIVGMTVGASKSINLKFPSPYHSAELAGKPVEFKVTLKGLKKKDLPALTDDFVKGLGGIESVEKLRQTIRDDIQQSDKKRIEGELKNRILKVLVQNNPVAVPPSMLKEQKQALIDDTKRRMTEQGMPEADFAEYTSKWEQDFESTASEMIQSGFLVDAIAKKHELGWNEEDVNAKFDEYVKQTGIELARIKEFYSRPEQMQRMTYMITEEKVLDFLIKASKVKEVEASKLKQ